MVLFIDQFSNQVQATRAKQSCPLKQRNYNWETIVTAVLTTMNTSMCLPHTFQYWNGQN